LRPAAAKAAQEQTVPPLPGTEPFSFDGSDSSVGVLLCHGFTGSPASMRPWGRFLADAGFSVRLPRLPGHGTRWQDLQLTRWPDWYGTVEDSFSELRRQCDQVFVAGLSMGATLALRLAEIHGDAVAGIVVVNPSLMSMRRSMRALPVLEKVVASAAGIGNDIAKPGVLENGYGRTPLRALRSLTELWAITRADLGRIEQPILIFRSAVDHVVEPQNTAVLLNGIRSTDLEERVLPRSFHVATLDHDAAMIFSGTVEFITRLKTADAANSPFSVQD
jgi:carboxylesterase